MSQIKTHGSELHGQETNNCMAQKNMCGHYYELFTCRDGFVIFDWIVQSFS